MRQRCGLQPAATDIISLTIGNYHDAPLNARKIKKNVYPTAANRDNILDTDPIYLYHPSPRQDMQSSLALAPVTPAHSPVLIENRYLAGVHSANDPNVSTYTIYMYLPPTTTTRPSSLRSLPTNSPTCSRLGSPRLRRAWTPYKKTVHTKYAQSSTTNESPTQRG